MAITYESNLEGCLTACSEATINGLDALGLFIRDQAVRNITNAHLVDTGLLRSSINHEVINADKVVQIGTNVEYAMYSEFGTGVYAENGQGRKTPWVYEDSSGVTHLTRGQRAVRYLRNAFENNHDTMRKIYQNAYNIVLK